MLNLNFEKLLGNGFLLILALRQHFGELNRYLLVSDPLVYLPKLERHEGLQEPGTVVGAGGVSLLEDVLGQLAVELSADVGQVRLDVDELLSLPFAGNIESYGGGGVGECQPEQDTGVIGERRS